MIDSCSLADCRLEIIPCMITMWPRLRDKPQITSSFFHHHPSSLHPFCWRPMFQGLSLHNNSSQHDIIEEQQMYNEAVLHRYESVVGCTHLSNSTLDDVNYTFRSCTASSRLVRLYSRNEWKWRLILIAYLLIGPSFWNHFVYLWWYWDVDHAPSTWCSITKDLEWENLHKSRMKK